MKQEQEAISLKQKEESIRAFDTWVGIKEMRDQCIRCLELKMKPVLVMIPAHDDVRGSQTSMAMMRRSQASTSSSLQAGMGQGNHAYQITLNTIHPMKSKENKEIIEFCIDMGKAMKKVDR